MAIPITCCAGLDPAAEYFSRFLTVDDTPSRAERKCNHCKLDLSPKMWQSMRRERHPYVFECEACWIPILSSGTCSDDYSKTIATEGSEKRYCTCHCTCEDLDLLPPRTWYKAEPALQTVIYKKFEPRCKACILKPWVEEYVQNEGYCQRDLYHEYLMLERARLGKLVMPPTRNEVEADKPQSSLQPVNRYSPANEIIKEGHYPKRCKSSTETISGLPADFQSMLLKRDPDAFGMAVPISPSLMYENGQYHTKDFHAWVRLAASHELARTAACDSLNKSRSESNVDDSIAEPGPSPCPYTNAITQIPEIKAMIDAERAALLEYFSQPESCKGVHRRASLCSIDGNLEECLARIETSTLPNSFEPAIHEHFDRHMHRLILRRLKEWGMKLVSPANVWSTVAALKDHPLRIQV
ncbi:hypothetical protein LTR84_002670 [Exophiala bonariae]|uniref:Uncharacterized protein n=1 Tax=Exophiala bonariae TaxID=1690606 RepID=A0AAV9N8C8_9EURO|nr:hypothetical protein LTR84_002670 [Exophiala bonariae]